MAMSPRSRLFADMDPLGAAKADGRRVPPRPASAQSALPALSPNRGKPGTNESPSRCCVFHPRQRRKSGKAIVTADSMIRVRAIGRVKKMVQSFSALIMAVRK